MNYYYSLTDKNGFVHSIDNVIFTYLLKNYNMKSVADELIAIRKLHNCSGWEKLNCAASSKYSWFQNTVHIDSIHLAFGKYSDWDKITRTRTLIPALRLEVNPNKHYQEPVFEDVMTWIKQNCTSGQLMKYDYAIDVPLKMNSVKVFSSRKEAGLYKGTIYRGQRSQHGFMKIYDKAKEQHLSTPLTRIEHTLDARKPASLENIYIVSAHNQEQYVESSKVNQCIIRLCLALQSLGEDFEPYLTDLNYRKREKLNPFLYDGLSTLEYDPKILSQLVEKIRMFFDADAEPEPSEDGFVEITDLSILPF